MNILQPTNIWSLCSSVEATFVGFGAEEYSAFIFLGTEECKKTDECGLVPIVKQ
jgi:hypothetical protein